MCIESESDSLALQLTSLKACSSYVCISPQPRHEIVVCGVFLSMFRPLQLTCDPTTERAVDPRPETAGLSLLVSGSYWPRIHRSSIWFEGRAKQEVVRVSLDERQQRTQHPALVCMFLKEKTTNCSCLREVPCSVADLRSEVRGPQTQLSRRFGSELQAIWKNSHPSVLYSVHDDHGIDVGLARSPLCENDAGEVRCVLLVPEAPHTTAYGQQPFVAGLSPEQGRGRQPWRPEKHAKEDSTLNPKEDAIPRCSQWPIGTRAQRCSAVPKKGARTGDPTSRPYTNIPSKVAVDECVICSALVYRVPRRRRLNLHSNRETHAPAVEVDPGLHEDVAVYEP